MSCRVYKRWGSLQPLSDMTQTEVIVSLKVLLFSENDAYCAHTWSYSVPITPVPVRVRQQMGSLCVHLPVESAVPSSSSHRHTEHLCKHRATTAKHRCWRTANTPLWEQCATIRLPKHSFLYSPPQKEKLNNSFHLQNLLSRERIS